MMEYSDLFRLLVVYRIPKFCPPKILSKGAKMKKVKNSNV